MRDVLLDTYKDFAGITLDTEVPSQDVRSTASRLLGPVKVEPR
jgi:hypothetical protein